MSEISPDTNSLDAASTSLPVVVLGAGPIGLSAAAELVGRGQDVLVLEAGHQSAAGVRSWGHVRLFSPWSELTSPAGIALVESVGWQHPDPDRYPTGAEWVDDYLAPLADALGDRIRLGQRVVGVARQDRDLLVDSGRESRPFVVHVVDPDGAGADGDGAAEDGTASRVLARAVIDATGTLSRPNPLGSEGYPVSGERAAADWIRYGLPDPVTDVERYADRTTAVVGSGASALTALIALTSESLYTQGSRVLWVLRRGAVGDSYGGGEADELPARGALGLRVRQAVAAGLIKVVTGFRTVAIEQNTATTDPGGGSVVLVGSDGRRIDGVDQVVCATGFRPDLSFLSEVRLELDDRLQAPVRLAPEIDPNQHSCGSVQPHGHRVLAQPEQGLYLVGMKSYGRAPSFLAMTGFEQVRSIAAALAGDLAAADDVRLKLPDTGVCGGAGLFDDTETAGGGCCAPAAPELISLTSRPVTDGAVGPAVGPGTVGTHSAARDRGQE